MNMDKMMENMDKKEMKIMMDRMMSKCCADMTEEEKISEISIVLSQYVKIASHGYRPPSVPVEPHLIGDSRYGDDDWDEFH